MPSSIVASLELETRKAYQQLDALAKHPLKLNLSVDSSKFPLGRISKDISQIDRSLAAANARVIAFAASAGQLFAIQRALVGIFKASVDVEKTLADINVILNRSTSGLESFKKTLFSIGNQTGQSFKSVAEAAKELSRQGLSAEQTLQRTKDALILSRLAGIDAASSVDALTAAINSFNKSGLTSTELINKLARVDAAFAVSSADLAEAIRRVGSTAQDANVDIDQLIALVTTAQQITARGGSVIGNSFKTIFTRLQRSSTLDELEALGIAVKDLQRNTLPAVQILQNLAGSYDKLSQAQRAQLSELVGGVYQINILKATLSDVSKEYGIYNQALDKSRSATNEAIERNKELNNTLAALLNAFKNNLTQFSAKVGETSLTPLVENVVKVLNLGLSGFNENAGESFGGKLGKGILTGIGNVLGGPGLAITGIVISKLFVRFLQDIKSAASGFLSVNRAANDQKVIQSQISKFLLDQPNLIARAASSAAGLAEVQAIVLKSIIAQNQQLDLATKLSGAYASNLRGANLIKVGKLGGEKITTPTTKALAGFSPINDAIQREQRMGVPSSLIRVGQDSNLASSKNPLGLGVYNLRDEPMGLKQGIARVAAQGLNPKVNGIPNFAPLKSAAEAAMERTNPQYIPRMALSSLELANNRTALEAKRLGKIFNEISERLLPIIQEIKLVNAFVPRFEALKNRQGPFPMQGPQDTNIMRAFPGGASSTQHEKHSLSAAFPYNSFGSHKDFLEEIEKQRSRWETEERHRNRAAGEADIGRKSTLNRINELSSKAGNIFGFKARRELTGLSSNSDLEIATPAQLALQSGKSQLKQSLIDKSFIPALVAPIVASTVAEFIPQKTRGGRATAAGVSGLGDIASFAGLGAVVGGGIPGAVVGGLVGTLSATYKIFREFNDLLPEFNRRFEESRQVVAENENAISEFASIIELYQSTIQGTSKLTPQQQQNIQRRAGGILNRFNLSEESSLSFINKIKTGDQGGALNILRDAGMSGQSKLNSRTLQNQLLGLSSIKLDQFDNNDDISNFVSNLSGFSNSRGGGAAQVLSNSSFKKILEDAEKSADSFSNFSPAALKYRKDIPAVTSATGGVSTVLQAALGIQPDSPEGKGLSDAITQLARTSPKSFTELIQQLLNIKNPEQLGSQLFKSIGFAINLNKALESLTFMLETAGDKLVANLERNISRENFSKQLGFFTAEQGLNFNKNNIDPVSFLKQSSILNRNAINSQSLLDRKSLGVNAIGDINKLASGIPSNIKGGQANLFDLGATAFAITKFQSQLKILSSGDPNDIIKVRENLNALRKEFGQRFSKTPQTAEAIDKIFLQIESILNKHPDNLQKVLDKELHEIQKSRIGEFFDKLGLTREKLSSFGGGIQGLSNTTDNKKQLLTSLSLLNSSNPELSLRGGVGAINALKGLGKRNPEIEQQTGIALGKVLKGQGITGLKAFSMVETMMNDLLPLTEKWKLGIITSISTQDTYLSIRNDEISELENQLKEEKSNFQLEKQLSERLRALKIQEINLEEEKLKYSYGRGETFSSDFASERSRIRERRILAGDYNPAAGTAEAFTDQFRYNTQDFYRDLGNGSQDVATTIKSSFNGAFNSIIQGTKSVEDAFRDMGLNILNKITEITTEIALNQIFSAILNATGLSGTNFSSALGKSSGGSIKRYAGGGKVYGGSGTKDDVPALLSEGEYVLRKSAVNKIGTGFLDKLNSSSVGGYAAGGRGVNILLQNDFAYDNARRPKSGKLAVDSRLSVAALSDENNPQNIIRMEREENLFRYLADRFKYKKSKDKALSEFEKQQLMAQYIALGQAVLSVSATAYNARTKNPNNPNAATDVYEISSRANGGYIRKFAQGGMSQDKVPALLMGGEYVVRKQAVDRYGVDFFDRMNQGMVTPRFAYGGSIGSSSVQTNNQVAGFSNEMLDKLIQSNERIQKLLETKTQEPKRDSATAPNVNITVNIMNSADGKNTKSNTDISSEGSNSKQNREFAKKLTERMKEITLKTISEQQRPGGLLSKIER